MIYRSEYGPRCPHCGNVNPAAILRPEAERMPAVPCIFCRKPFSFWIEKLPFFCTDTKTPAGELDGEDGG